MNRCVSQQFVQFTQNQFPTLEVAQVINIVADSKILFSLPAELFDLNLVIANILHLTKCYIL